MWLRRFRGLSHLSALALLTTFLALAFIYSLITPPGEAPDEVGHFDYVVHLLAKRTLPVQRMGELNESHQPPLYYAIAALFAAPADIHDSTGTFKLNPRFMWAPQGGNQINAYIHTTAETFPFHGHALAIHLARAASVLMGLGTVALTIAIGWAIFPDRRLIGLLAGALVAFNPQFLFISGAVNNDNLLAMACTGALWQTLRVLKRPEQRRQWAYVGLWIAVAILAKPSGFVIGLVAGLVLLACAAQRRSLKLFIRGALPIALVVASITGWWFARNQALYGDLLGFGMYQRVAEVVLRRSPLEWSDLGRFFSVQFRSFWSYFGWVNVPAPLWFYVIALLMSLLAVAGIGLLGLKRWFGKLADFQKAALLLLGLAILAQEAYMLGAITHFNESWYQGRYIFPVIGPSMALMSLGLHSLMPKRLAPSLVAGLSVILLGVAAFMPFQVIGPAYRIAPLPKWSLWFVPNKTEFIFGQAFELKGYSIQEGVDEITVTLYWQAAQRPDLDYSVFAHLVDESGELIAQKDHAPGQNRDYPPTAWWPGDIIVDEHVIPMPPQLAPGIYRFRIGVYNWATGERLPALAKGKPVGDFVLLDQAVRL